MRKITKDAIKAFMRYKAFKRDNTEVVIDHDGGSCLLLHGNLIAKRYTDGPQEVEINSAGWQTNTTKERLNGIPGVSISQKNFQWFLNGEPWDGDWTMVYP